MVTELTRLHYMRTGRMLRDQHISHDSIPIDSRSQKKTHFMLPCYVLLQFLCTSCICHRANKTLQTIQFDQFSLQASHGSINLRFWFLCLYPYLRTIPTNQPPEPQQRNSGPYHGEFKNWSSLGLEDFGKFGVWKWWCLEILLMEENC